MMFDLNGHLLPREMSIEAEDGQRKIVQMDWSPIVNEQGVIEKVLLITQDVTHLRELELSSAQQKDELDTISRIIRISIGKFNEFIESAANFIAANRRLINEAQGDAQRRDPQLIAALFRNMHTIKGNARTFEFTHITDVAHRAEQTYDRLRKDATAEWNVAEMIAELDAVESAVTRYVRVNEDKLGRKGRAAEMLTTRGAFVANEQLVQLGEMAAALAASDTSAGLAKLRKAIDQLGLISLSRLVSGAVDSLSSLASELHKPTPNVDLVNGDIAFNSQFAEALKSCLMHIVRNSLDHGIGAPADRMRAHKPEQGTLRFACERRGDRVELHISDDGRGLALHKLYEKGVAGGLFGSGEQPTCDAVADIIFRSGLSTSEAVTQVSGRGVGMDAVRTFLNEQGATIRVALKQAGQKLGFAPFEFIVRREAKMAQILVVDDSSTVRDEVTTFLKNAGLDVISAVDGKDGLVKLKSDPGIKLVVADVNMPNMDGLTMVEKIRSELGNSRVNLIMLTTESSPNMKERGKAAGVKGWIVKPFKGTAVLETFKKLVA